LKIIKSVASYSSLEITKDDIQVLVDELKNIENRMKKQL